MNKIALVFALSMSLLTTGCGYSSAADEASFTVGKGLSGKIYHRAGPLFEHCFIEVREDTTNQTVYSSLWSSCSLYHALNK